MSIIKSQIFNFADDNTLCSFNKGPYHIETSPMICSANQWTGFYVIETSGVKKLIVILETCSVGLKLIPWPKNQKPKIQKPSLKG